MIFDLLGTVILATGGMLYVEKHNQERQARKKMAPRRPEVEPKMEALLTAKAISQSLPSPIAAHALSQLTNVPCILVPLSVPTPPVPDLQALLVLLTAARKHALAKWGSQSWLCGIPPGGEELGVGEWVDMGLWVGRLGDEDGEGKEEEEGEKEEERQEGEAEGRRRSVAGKVVGQFTDGKASAEEVAREITLHPLPTSTSSALHQSLSSLFSSFVFSLPPKNNRIVTFFVGKNPETGSYLALVGCAPDAAVKEEKEEKGVRVESGRAGVISRAEKEEKARDT